MQRVGFGGHGPPLIVGGTGDTVLRVAARHADIVGIAGANQVPGQPPGTMRIATAAEADDRVRFARECTGDRADGRDWHELQWHALIQLVVPTDDRRATADELAARYGGMMMAAADILESPFLLLGTVEQMAEQVLANRERYGFTYYTVHGPYVDAFAPVIERLRS